jgi:hypothetical protein
VKDRGHRNKGRETERDREEGEGWMKDRANRRHIFIAKCGALNFSVRRQKCDAICLMRKVGPGLNFCHLNIYCKLFLL